MVSMLTGISRSMSALSTGTTRLRSALGSRRSAPGLVDSPPTSMKSAPAACSETAWATAASTFTYLPPSLNESGVTFSTPTMTGLRRGGTVGRMRATVLAIEASPCAAKEREHTRTFNRVAQRPTGGKRHRCALRLAHPAGCDAAVTRSQHDEYTTRLEPDVERLSDFLGQPLLELR